MGANHVELESFITPELVEEAYRQAIKATSYQHRSFPTIGMRAAQARDPKLLKVLEKAAEIVGKMSEAQMGQTRRGIDVPFSHTKEHTEAQLWREAYRLCDEGRPIENFSFIYGAAAWICGYQT